MELKELEQRFFEIFTGETGQTPKVFFSPGRINLIGEHIDYNGGFVFPAAITFGTYAVVTERSDNKVAIYSGNFADDGLVEFALTDLTKQPNEPWTIYVKGVIDVFTKASYEITTGFNAYVIGTIPNGAGLSSSASLELLVGKILSDLNGFELTGIENALLGQKAENEYVGVNCGIMDQFAIGMGQENKAIKLNCDTLDYEYADCDLQDYRVLIMNTKKRRGLADSKYNERRAECDAAVELLQTKAEITYLCDLTVTEFDAISAVLTEDNLLKRARHAVTENERVKLAVDALATGDLVAFGQLLNQSHTSLRDDYEVTGIELDTIVELAWDQDGVLGARMTGAGFGGCAIALVHKDKLVTVQDAIATKYEAIIGYPAEFYVAQIGDGTKRLV